MFVGGGQRVESASSSCGMRGSNSRSRRLTAADRSARLPAPASAPAPAPGRDPDAITHRASLPATNTCASIHEEKLDTPGGCHTCRDVKFARKIFSIISSISSNISRKL